MRHIRAWRVVAPLTVLTALATSCSSGGGSAGGPGAAEPIVIGHAAGTTGFMSIFDIPVEQGMTMAIEDINAKGGVLGRPLKLITTDNASDVSKIQTAAQDILDQGAQFVVTACDFDMGGPAARVANGAGKIAMGCAGGPLYGVEGIGPLTYNVYPGSPTEGATLAEYAKDKGYTRPFVITDQSLEYPQVVGDYFEKRWADLGGTLAGQATYQNSDESAAAQLAAAQRARPDVIVVASYPPGGATLLRQLRSAGLTQPVLGTAAYDGVYWTDAVPGISDFTILSSGGLNGDDPVPARNEFFTRFKAETGKPAASATYPLSGYSMVQALARAVERAGSTDTAAVQAELDRFTNEDLLIGPTTYTPSCHLPSSRPMLLKTYTDGVPKVTGERTVQSLMGRAPC